MISAILDFNFLFGLQGYPFLKYFLLLFSILNLVVPLMQFRLFSLPPSFDDLTSPCLPICSYIYSCYNAFHLFFYFTCWQMVWEPKSTTKGLLSTITSLMLFLKRVWTMKLIFSRFLSCCIINSYLTTLCRYSAICNFVPLGPSPASSGVNGRVVK